MSRSSEEHETECIQRIVQSGIVVLVERVEVEAKGAYTNRRGLYLYIYEKRREQTTEKFGLIEGEVRKN